MSGEVPPPMPSRVSPWTVYDVFTLARGEQLFIGAVSDKQWVQLCEVLGREDLRDDPALATNEQRLPVRRDLLDALGETLAQLEIEDVSRRLDQAGLPYAPITRPDELLDDPHLRASGGLVPLANDEEGTTQTVLLPLLMGGKRPQVRMPLARIGEHTQEVLGKLGLATDRSL